MTRKLAIIFSFFFILLHSIPVKSDGFRNVEIFDPKQDKVVKAVQSNPEIQKMVTEWITNIDSIGRNDPATDDGYAVKIPLDPAVEVHNRMLNAKVSEVYIIIPKKEPPAFLIFETESRLMSYHFNGDIDKLSKALDFKLKKKPIF